MTNTEMMNDLRTHDYERYLCCLMQPAAEQARLFALLALNQELAKAAEQASEPAVGAIRLKWWEEVLQGKRAASEHPLLPILFEAGVGAEAVALIAPRMSELENRKGFENKAAFDAYLKASSGVLHQLLAQSDDAVIADAGAFFALVGSLRAMPYLLERGVVRLPLDVLRQHGISPAAIEAGLEKEAFAHLMAYWLGEIDARAQALQAPIKAAPKLVKRLHIAALLYAQALKKAGGDPTKLPPRLPNLPLKLWLKA